MFFYILLIFNLIILFKEHLLFLFNNSLEFDFALLINYVYIIKEYKII